ncbi:MAG: hypothetical protein SFY69_01025 [Planctomycetota bacterium]|nr:hypothetical protein [Planctomycetota bacterium]
MSTLPPNPDRRPVPRAPLMHPRRVRGGVKLPGGVLEGPVLWAGQRWMRVIESVAPGTAMVEGLEYAKEGQTKRLTISPGKIEGLVQGRSDRPYVTQISMSVLPEASWERVVRLMGEGAIYAAKLLAGELPTNIEDALGPLDLRLFPVEPKELTASCTCDVHRAAVHDGQPEGATSDARWCKHACCVGYLVAQRLAVEPYLMFALRGLDGAELLERLREQRTMASAGERAPVYAQHVPAISETPGEPLETVIDTFWDAPASLREIEIPMGPPPVSHPLLRRLGPSPLQGTFPMVGLLASCYDLFSEQAIRRAAGEGNAPGGETPDG